MLPFGKIVAMRSHPLGRLCAFILLLLILGLSSCADRAPIPDSEFREVLSDILLANEVIRSNDSLYAEFEAGKLQPYAEIFEAHGCTAELFDSALLFYVRNPERLDSILDNLVAQLKKEEEAYNAARFRLETLDLESLDREEVINRASEEIGKSLIDNE